LDTVDFDKDDEIIIVDMSVVKHISEKINQSNIIEVFDHHQ